MKRKFKPGDVVEFVDESRLSNWYAPFIEMNGCTTFIVGSYATECAPEYTMDELDNVHLLQMDGKPARWNAKRMCCSKREYGVNSGSLQKNKFLTAVHKAQKQMKQQKRKEKTQ